MKLRTLASNMTEVEINGNTFLFSYKTPVACHLDGVGFFKTDEKWSVTTSRHINKWLRECQNVNPETTETKPQSFFDNYVN